ncbi:flagellar filament capping protein FliD, partial [Proteus mirabilis]|nr:flagellar filament capping protein FliD [Proteus mirabilis]
DAFKVTHDGKAIIGNYTVSVTELAHSQTLKSKAVSDIKDTIGETLGEVKKLTLVITQKVEKETLKIELTDSQTSII